MKTADLHKIMSNLIFRVYFFWPKVNKIIVTNKWHNQTNSIVHWFLTIWSSIYYQLKCCLPPMGKDKNFNVLISNKIPSSTTRRPTYVEEYFSPSERKETGQPLLVNVFANPSALLNSMNPARNGNYYETRVSNKNCIWKSETMIITSKCKLHLRHLLKTA